MFNRLIVFIFLALIPFAAFTQKVTIQGKAPDYEGKKISFYTFSDPILYQKKELGSATVDKGSFIFELSVNQTIEVYADLEKFTGTIIIEPGRNYVITLPPYTPRTEIEKKSPYFRPSLYWLGLSERNNEELNFIVRSFVTDYNKEITKNSSAFMTSFPKEKAEGIIEYLETKYSGNKTDFFRVLKKYYYADLEMLVNPGKPDLIIEKYFAKEPLKLQNPSYQRMFRNLFTDFLRNLSLDYSNTEINLLVGSYDFKGLVNYFQKKGYNLGFAELAVLKGLYDGYYTGVFGKADINKTIENAQNVLSGQLNTIACGIKNKITRLAVKGRAPAFRLHNTQNEEITLDKLRGKFILLNFIRSDDSECIAELDSIVSIERKFRQVLSVVSVSVNDDFEKSAKLWKSKNYIWELLDGSKHKEVSEDYDAEIVPLFYLIDPNGNLLLSPAPPPSHDLEGMFLKILRERRRP